MKMTVLYDNKVLKKGIGLKSDWGFACIIHTKHDTILFDTGANGKILLQNMKTLNINPKSIKKIVISHEHSDHKGGLITLTKHVDYIDLYRLANEVPSSNMKLASAEDFKEISNNVWSTGRLKSLVDEQSLILKGVKGCYILTGCSHPGLEKILDVAKQIGKIVGIVGGLHGFNKFSLLENFDFICPCHCTSHKQDLKKAFPDSTFECGVGKIIDLSEGI